MKRLFASVLIIFMLFSCDISDDSEAIFYEFVSVNTAELATEMQLNEVYEINVVYERPTNCYVYNNIYYNHESTFERTVAIMCSVHSGTNCEPDNTEYEVSFNFRPTNIGTYTFYFWQGEDEDGESQFLTVEAVVSE